MDAYDDSQSIAQMDLKKTIELYEARGYSTEKAIESFRQRWPKEADTLIKSWNSNPW